LLLAFLFDVLSNIQSPEGCNFINEFVNQQPHNLHCALLAPAKIMKQRMGEGLSFRSLIDFGSDTQLWATQLIIKSREFVGQPPHRQAQTWSQRTLRTVISPFSVSHLMWPLGNRCSNRCSCASCQTLVATSPQMVATCCEHGGSHQKRPSISFRSFLDLL
jgi:hypothetical protein